LGFLVEGTQSVNTLVNEGLNGPAVENAPPRRPMNPSLLHIWLLLYSFVGTQLGWTLRPFFGIRGDDFTLFRDIEGNFYSAIIQSFFSLFF
jgi:hypothetical protein